MAELVYVLKSSYLIDAVAGPFGKESFAPLSLDMDVES